jgi:hypothetical protein
MHITLPGPACHGTRGLCRIGDEIATFDEPYRKTLSFTLSTTTP